jgi:hypothetical protein
MTATTLCRPCGTELRVSAKFCDECGSPIAVPGRPAEYKQVTVLFAELVIRLRVTTLAATNTMPPRSITQGVTHCPAAHEYTEKNTRITNGRASPVRDRGLDGN